MLRYSELACFMLPQGEVEQIALMKPKAQSVNDDGMLEFLEDIIGTNRYKEPIEELSKRVEELTEERGIKVWCYYGILRLLSNPYLS